MKSKLFSDLVKEYFDFLVETYGFSIKHEEYRSEVMGNASVIFESLHIGINIVLDRGQVLINIGPSSLPRQDWFEFSDVVHFFAPELEPLYNFPRNFADYENELENQMSRFNQIMCKYCEPLLLGDFSMQEKIRQIGDKRVAEMKTQFNGLSEEYKRKHSIGKQPTKPGG